MTVLFIMAINTYEDTFRRYKSNSARLGWILESNEGLNSGTGPADGPHRRRRPGVTGEIAAAHVLGRAEHPPQSGKGLGGVRGGATTSYLSATGRRRRRRTTGVGSVAAARRRRRPAGDQDPGREPTADDIGLRRRRPAGAADSDREQDAVHEGGAGGRGTAAGHHAAGGPPEGRDANPAVARGAGVQGQGEVDAVGGEDRRTAGRAGQGCQRDARRKLQSVSEQGPPAARRDSCQTRGEPPTLPAF